MYALGGRLGGASSSDNFLRFGEDWVSVSCSDDASCLLFFFFECRFFVAAVEETPSCCFPLGTEDDVSEVDVTFFVVDLISLSSPGNCSLPDAEVTTFLPVGASRSFGAEVDTILGLVPTLCVDAGTPFVSDCWSKPFVLDVLSCGLSVRGE